MIKQRTAGPTQISQLDIGTTQILLSTTILCQSVSSVSADALGG